MQLHFIRKRNLIAINWSISNGIYLIIVYTYTCIVLLYPILKITTLNCCESTFRNKPRTIHEWRLPCNLMMFFDTISLMHCAMRYGYLVSEGLHLAKYLVFWAVALYQNPIFIKLIQWIGKFLSCDKRKICFSEFGPIVIHTEFSGMLSWTNLRRSYK